MSLETAVNSIYLINGVRQVGANVPGLFVGRTAETARTRAADTLYLQVSVAGQLDETAPILEECVAVFTKAFFETDGGVSAAQQKAANAVNRFLIDRNKTSEVTVKREGSLVSAVIHENELYLASVGETMMLIGHGFGLEPHVEREGVVPLGRTEPATVRFGHHWLQTGMHLLIGDPRIGHVDSAEFSPHLGGTAHADALTGITSLLSSQTARLILVTFLDEDASLNDDVVFEDIPPNPVQATAQLPTYDEARDIRETRREEVKQTAYIREKEPAVVRESRAVNTDAYSPLPKGSYEESYQVNPLRRLASGFLAWLSRLFRRLARLITPAEDAERFAARDVMTMLAIALIVPILVATIGATTFFRWTTRADFLAYSQLAQEQFSAAQNTADDQTARLRYRETLSYVEDARALRPRDRSLDTILFETEQALDGLDDVNRLPARVLVQFDDRDVELGSMAIDSGLTTLFVLDKTTQNVYSLNPEDPTLVPDLVYEGVDPVFNQVADIEYLEGTGLHPELDGLAVLERGGALTIDYLGRAGTQRTTLPFAEAWATPIDLEGYNGNTYVLDTVGGEAGRGQIYRFLADGNAFTVRRGSEYLTIPESEAIVDFEIIEDGSVVALYADGRLRRYLGDELLWDETTVLNSGIDSGIVSPTALIRVGTGLNGTLYVLDPPTNRLLKFTRTGNYLGQFRAEIDGQDLFAVAEDVVVYENPFRIYATVGNVIAVVEE